MTSHRTEYVQDWQRKNKSRVRMHKLVWYYRNKIPVNAMFSKGNLDGLDYLKT